MSTIAVRNPIRCFCSFVAKRTEDNTLVCGKYKSGGMVCLFHLHDENLENYHQPNIFPMSLDCDLCLVTLKISSKEYLAPCRLTSIRCRCGDVATFHQSKKDNLNHNSYFFSCPNWRGPNKCSFFFWSNDYRTTRDVQILRRLIFEGEMDSEQPRKRLLDEDTDDTNKKQQDLERKFECVICFTGERSYLITPCNHLCCCSTCAGQIKNHCPICRGHIASIQRIFFV